MTLHDWFTALVTGITGKTDKPRRQLWNRTTVTEKLEPRLLLSASSNDSDALFQPRLTDPADDPGPFPAAFISLNLINLGDFGTPESLAPASPEFHSLNGELADDGGAVWGTVADEGVDNGGVLAECGFLTECVGNEFGGGDEHGTAADGSDSCNEMSDHDGGVDGIWGTVADEGTYDGDIDAIVASPVLRDPVQDLCDGDGGVGKEFQGGVLGSRPETAWPWISERMQR